MQTKNRNRSIKLGIVVVAYRNPTATASFVNKEISKIHIPYRCIIVNNASTTEETMQLAKACQAQYMDKAEEAAATDQNVFIIGTDQNLGYAKGNNLGVEFLNRNYDVDYFLFSNDDIEIQSSNCIERLIETIEESSRIGGIGPRIIGLDGKDQSPHHQVISIWRQIGWNLFPFLRRKRKDTGAHVPQSGYCYWVSGAFMLVKAKAFNEVQGFDPHTFLYVEEKILAERFKRVGYAFYFKSNVSVLHYEGGSTKKDFAINSTKKQILLNSDCYYYNQYLGHNRLIILLFKFSTWIHGKSIAHSK